MLVHQLFLIYFRIKDMQNCFPKQGTSSQHFQLSRSWEKTRYMVDRHGVIETFCTRTKFPTHTYTYLMKLLTEGSRSIKTKQDLIEKGQRCTLLRKAVEWGCRKQLARYASRPLKDRLISSAFTSQHACYFSPIAD